MPTTTQAVSAMNSQNSPTHGRAARPMSVSTMPHVSILLSPKREARGTAASPMTAKKKPGIAVTTPASRPPAPNEVSTPSSTAPSDAMPARRLIAAMNTATKISSTGRYRVGRPGAGEGVMRSSSPTPGAEWTAGVQGRSARQFEW